MVSYIGNRIAMGLGAVRNFAEQRPLLAAATGVAAFGALAYYGAPAFVECLNPAAPVCIPQPMSCVTESITPLFGSEWLGQWYYGPPSTTCTQMLPICPLQVQRSAK